MKILHENLTQGVIKFSIDNLDDLWYLSTLVDKGDFVKGSTYRKIKVGTDENCKVIKKKVFLKLLVESIEFHRYTDSLRIGGNIVDGPEDISRGSHHTFNIDSGSILTLEKKKWLKFHVDRLREASNSDNFNILLCIFDREQAIFAKLKKYGFDVISSLKGNVSKKAFDQDTSNFYQEIVKVIQGYEQKQNFNYIILASPAFYREYLLKEIKDDKLKKKISTATCSSVSVSGINEVLKRPELKDVLQKDRASKEMKLVDDLMENISKDKLAVYGFEHTQNASNAGAVKLLLVTDKLIHDKRLNDSFADLEEMMNSVENSKGEITIISSEHEGGKKIDSLGGVGGILRYQFE